MRGRVPPLNQSGVLMVNCCTLPSEYTTCPVPLAGPYVAVTRKPRVPPERARLNPWPLATALSGWPGAADGQVNVSPPAVTVPPGVTPAAASAWADRLDPDPSMSPAPGVASSVVPTLVSVAANEAAGTFTVAVVRSPSLVCVSSVNTACTMMLALDVAVAGTVMVNGWLTDCPGAGAPRSTGGGGRAGWAARGEAGSPSPVAAAGAPVG